MNWNRANAFSMHSDPPGYAVGRAAGARYTYRAVRVDKPYPELLVVRDVDPNDDAARNDAITRCQSACEAAANV